MFIKQNKLFVISGVGFFLFSFVESWRLTRLGSSPDDLLFSYSTYPIICFVVLVYCYFAILARYKVRFSKQHQLLKLVYIPSMFTLMLLGYLIGLNIDSIIGVKDATDYLFVFPLGVNIIIILTVISIYVFVIYQFLSKKRSMIFLTVIMSIVFFLLLTTVVTSYAMQFDILNGMAN
jgi:hypothetical protein